MPGEIVENTIVNYKIEYRVRNESGAFLELVQVSAVDVETGITATMYDGPFSHSLEVTDNNFSGENMGFYLRKGTYDITITDVSTGNRVILSKYFVGNNVSLPEDTNDHRVFAWQRHIVANNGMLINNPLISVERYVTDVTLQPATFLPSMMWQHGPVNEYTYDSYVLLYVPAGLYRITARDINGNIIRIFDHVSVGVSAVDTPVSQW